MARISLLNVMTVINLYLEIKSLPTEAMIFLGHPDAADFYEYLKSRLDLRNYHDPFLQFDRPQRSNLCNLLLTANIYSMPGPLTGIRESPASWRIMKNYQDVGHIRGNSEEMLRCTKAKMINRSQVSPVNVFPCVVNEVDRFIIFLTYGFEAYEKRMFVLVTTFANYLQPLRMVAVLEANPLFDIGLSPPQYLYNRFRMSTEAKNVGTSTSRDFEETSLMLGSTTSKDEGFGISTTFQHFCVCCSVADEVRTIFDLDIKTYNFVYPMTEVREETRAIIDENDKLITYAKVLPCSVNFEWTQPKFYVMRDRQQRTSLFLFRPIKSETFGTALKLEGIVDLVTSLQDH